MARYVTFYGISHRGEKQLGYECWSVIEFSDAGIVGIEYYSLTHQPFTNYSTIEEALKENNKWVEISVDLAKRLMQLSCAVTGNDADNMYNKFAAAPTSTQPTPEEHLTPQSSEQNYKNRQAEIFRSIFS
jgi:hypothetical protein